MSSSACLRGRTGAAVGPALEEKTARPRQLSVQLICLEALETIGCVELELGSRRKLGVTRGNQNAEKRFASLA